MLETLIPTVVGGAMGLGSDAIAQGRQEKLMDKQLDNQLKLNEANRKTQMQMWKDTNYSAQVGEMNKAGINPGLLYGIGGGGSATTGSAGGNATGGNPTNSMVGAMGMGLQLGLMKAQKENIEADTRNKNVDADVKGGVGVQKTMQEALNIKADTALKDAQTRIANIQADINEESKEEQIDKIKAESIGQILQNALTEIQTQKGKTDINVNEANVQKMAQDIAQGWRRLTIEQFKAEIEANFKGTSAIGGNVLNMVLDGINKVLGLKVDRTPIKVK